MLQAVRTISDCAEAMLHSASGFTCWGMQRDLGCRRCLGQGTQAVSCLNSSNLGDIVMAAM